MDTMKKVREILLNSNKKISVISRETSIPHSTLTSIVKSETKDIKFDTITKLAKYFNVTLDYFYDEVEAEKEIKNREVLGIYNSLTFPNQEKSIDYMKYLKSTQGDTELGEDPVPYTARVQILGQTAAGQPLMYGDTITRDISDLSDVPANADFALTVNGDSMEPLIKNGSIIYIHSQEDVENGTISIVELDGAVTCKKIYKEDNQLKLVSLNDKYEPMLIDKGDVRILGKVIL